jgi:hypothetical protein
MPKSCVPDVGKAKISLTRRSSAKTLGAEKRQLGKTFSEFHSQTVLPYRLKAGSQKCASLGQLQVHKMTIWTSPVDVLPLGAGPAQSDSHLQSD